MEQNKNLTENEKLQCQLFAEKALNALYSASFNILEINAKATVAENSKLKARVNELEAKLENATKPNVNLNIDVVELNNLLDYESCFSKSCSECHFGAFGDCTHTDRLYDFLKDLQSQLKGGTDND